MRIPFNKEYHFQCEIQYIKEVLDKGATAGDGSYTKLVEELLETSFDFSKVFMTTSGTHALEMAAIALDLKVGDEIIMPSYNFPSMANSVVLRGAMPVFAEISEDTMNIDAADIERRITDKTKGIYVIHYAGVGCDMDSIMDLASQYRLYVVEDAAQAVNAAYKGRYLGGIGYMGCLSFHGTKNYISGEGGALVFNSEDESMKRFLEIVRQKGTNRMDMIRGQASSYRWMNAGSSYCPSEVLMAMLYGQLKNLDFVKAARCRIFNIYIEQLSDLEDKGIIKLMKVPYGCEPNYHIFYILLKNEKERSRVQAELKEAGIGTAFHFMPLHSSPMGRSLGFKPEDLPATEDLSSRLLRLPIYTGMEVNEVEYVVCNLRESLMR